uniref:Bm562 n=1 Tax=Brugia malayi TaxID=6279 RepID=A0A0H5SME5_BRUMA|nr:Bm562 [Brugia malayi]
MVAIIIINQSLLYYFFFLRKPCYDFCPVQATAIKAVSTKESLPLKGIETAVSAFLETAQSRAATGGVYKGKGRNQRVTNTFRSIYMVAIIINQSLLWYFFLKHDNDPSAGKEVKLQNSLIILARDVENQW